MSEKNHSAWVKSEKNRKFFSTTNPHLNAFFFCDSSHRETSVTSFNLITLIGSLSYSDMSITMATEIPTIVT